MSDAADTLRESDEQVHPVDPEIWSWNESWFFSFIDRDGGPAGFFRLGLLPNQDRAMIWSFVHVDGRWLGVEESRLAFGHFDLSDGMAYDKWDLQLAWHPDPPAGRGPVHVQRHRPRAHRHRVRCVGAVLHRPQVPGHQRGRPHR